MVPSVDRFTRTYSTHIAHAVQSIYLSFTQYSYYNSTCLVDRPDASDRHQRRTIGASEHRDFRNADPPNAQISCVDTHARQPTLSSCIPHFTLLRSSLRSAFNSAHTCTPTHSSAQLPDSYAYPTSCSHLREATRLSPCRYTQRDKALSLLHVRCFSPLIHAACGWGNVISSWGEELQQPTAFP